MAILESQECDESRDWPPDGTGGCGPIGSPIRSAGMRLCTETRWLSSLRSLRYL